jgi:zinc transporter 5/7
MPSARNLKFGGLSYGSILRSLRSNFRIVLSKPESRKIFYFLVLNMAYMLVQMVYGIWTNSLGLISDGLLEYALYMPTVLLTHPYSSNTYGI